MRHGKHLAFASQVLIFGVVFTVLSFLLKPESVQPPRPAQPAVHDRFDSALERMKFDWLRTHDPASGEIPVDIRRKELEFAGTLPVRSARQPLRLGKGSAAAQVQVSDWRSQGPYNLGGRTRAAAYDVSRSNVILAGGVSGGMWRSTDGGQTWQKTTAPAQLYSVTALVQDTRSGKTDIWYYGTGELTGSGGGHWGAAFAGDGIYKSTDGGRTWNPLASTVSGTPQYFDQPFDYIWRLAIDPSVQNKDVVYAATFGGISRSENGGQSWQRVLGSFSNSSSYYTDIVVTSTGVAYAALSEKAIGNRTSADAGIWRSTDGTNWTKITPQGWPSKYQRIVLALAPSNQSVVYVLAVTPNSGKKGTYAGNDEWHSLWKYTWLSGDGSGAGGQWQDLSDNLPAFGGDAGDFASQGGYDMLLAVKPDDENFVIAGGVNLYRSTDGFSSTSKTSIIGGYESTTSFTSYPGHHADQHYFVFHPTDNKRALSVHDGGVSETSDITAGTVTWTARNNGYLTSQFYTVAIDEATAGSAKIMGGMQDNGTWSTNSTASDAGWHEELGGDGAFCAYAAGGSVLFASFQNGQTYRLTPTVWTRVDPLGGSGYLFINPFVLDPNNTSRMYMAGGSVIWRNSNLDQIPPYKEDPVARNWTKLNNSAINGETISALAISVSPAHRLYYGTTKGSLRRIDGANSGDPQPVDISTGKGLPANAYVSSIAIDPGNADRVIVAFSNYNILSLFYSTNGGNSWQAIAGNLEQYSNGTGNGPSVRWVRFLPLDDGEVIFAGTSVGLYATSTLDGMNTEWVQEAPDVIGNAIVDMVAVRESDGLVVAATHGAGVFKANVTAVQTSVEESGSAPVTSWALQQNYPNPFNPSTTITADIAEQRHVSLRVYDVLGREVAVLADEVLPVGRHRFVWDAGTLPAGTYQYRLQAGDFVASRMMQLIK